MKWRVAHRGRISGPGLRTLTAQILQRFLGVPLRSVLIAALPVGERLFCGAGRAFYMGLILRAG